MFKLFVTLIKGKLVEGGMSLSERNALPILSQQIREAARDVENARKAVALAIAREREEKEGAAALEAKIATLESRALAALDNRRQDLAREAAETIALMDNDLAATRQALSEMAPTVQILRQRVRQAEMRLVALQRGNRLAVARDSTVRLQRFVASTGSARLQEAEETLAQLERLQRSEAYAEEAYDGLRMDRKPDQTIEKLAAAGCGAPLASSADAVMTRLLERRRQDNA